MGGRATVLSEGPFKGRMLEAETDALLLPVRPFTGDRPLSPHDTNPHRRVPITLFGRFFTVWVPMDVPDYDLAEYVLSQLMNPLGLGLWREGEPIDGRAEDAEEATKRTRPNEHGPGVQRTPYRPGRVPEARGAQAGHHRHGDRPGADAG